MKVIERSTFRNFVDDLISNDERDVVGVTQEGGQYLFDELEDSSELALEYDLTTLPPKKYFLPPRETLLEYERSGEEYEMESVLEIEPRIVIGVHPWDLEAIEQMDKIFIEEHDDEYYERRREQCVIIGTTPQNVADETFAGDMKTATKNSGYDLLLTELDDKIAVEIGSRKGSLLIENVPKRDATFEEVEAVEAEKEAVTEDATRGLEVPKEALPTLLAAGYDEIEFWADHAEQCTSCSSCNVVCPTCYCFDIVDVNEVGAESGQRQRQWDGCNLKDFAAVAGDENFREERGKRYRHRFHRKGDYVYQRFGDIACTGCGRCGKHCLPDIADPLTLYNDLKAYLEEKDKLPTAGGSAAASTEVVSDD